VLAGIFGGRGCCARPAEGPYENSLETSRYGETVSALRFADFSARASWSLPAPHRLLSPLGARQCCCSSLLLKRGLPRSWVSSTCGAGWVPPVACGMPWSATGAVALLRRLRELQLASAGALPDARLTRSHAAQTPPRCAIAGPPSLGRSLKGL